MDFNLAMAITSQFCTFPYKMNCTVAIELQWRQSLIAYIENAASPVAILPPVPPKNKQTNKQKRPNGPDDAVKLAFMPGPLKRQSMHSTGSDTLHFGSYRISFTLLAHEAQFEAMCHNSFPINIKP